MRAPHYFLLTDYPAKMQTMFAAAPFRWTDPTTWPWIIYLRLAVLVGGWLLRWWRWLKRRRAAGWPIADGRIESTEVTKPNFHSPRSVVTSWRIRVLVFGRGKHPFRSVEA